MKSLKFCHDLVGKILNGGKTVTWRIFDDKDLQIGDQLQFIDAGEKKEFAKAEAILVREKPLSELGEVDYAEGHERYESPEEMLKTFRGYYGDKVNWDTVVKIVKFKLL